ncbi:MAG: hypothetical protein ABR961_04765 [Thermoanaerobaculaceae bacterium]|jgi:hypothetical protein
MASIAKVLKDELSRITRRETKMALTTVSKPAASLRRTTADLKRRVGQLEKERRSLRKTPHSLAKAQLRVAPETTDKACITARGMRSLWRRLGLRYASKEGRFPH